MMLWSIKKSLPITIIYSFLLFMCFPMYITLAKNNAGDRFSYVGLYEIFMEISPLLIIVATIITGCFMFNIYHKKRSVDLYASLPIKKHTLFLSRYFAGLIVIIVPFAVFMTLGLFASGNVDYLNTVFTYNKLLAYAVSILNMYSMLAFFSMLCGGIVDTLVSFAVVNIGVASCLSLGVSLISSIVPGCFNLDINMIDRFTGMLLFALCPVIMPYLSGTFGDIYCNSDGVLTYYLGPDSLAVETKTLIIWFVLAVVYFVASVIIAKKRRNENVQNGFIFSFPKIVIQFLASAAAGLILGYLLVENFSTNDNGFKTMLLFMFSAFVGSLLAFLIVTLIYNKGAKRFVQSIPTFIGSFLAVAIFYLAISLGWVGVSSVPKVDKIKSVAVFSENEYDGNFEEISIVSSKDNEFEMVDFWIEDKDVIKDTVELHQAIIDGLHDEEGTFFNIDDHYTDNNSETNYEPRTIRIDYTLNNGRKISKTYRYNNYKYDNIKDELNDVISSDIYKKQYFKLANCNTGDEANVSLMRVYTGYRYTNENVTNVYYNDKFYGDTYYISDTEDLEDSNIHDSAVVNELFATLHEEFLADDNYADTQKANHCEYVEQTRDNFEIYDEIVYHIDISYATELNYEAAQKKIDKIEGIIPGRNMTDPNEYFAITRESYPKTFALLDEHFSKENTDQIYMYSK